MEASHCSVQYESCLIFHFLLFMFVRTGDKYRNIFRHCIRKLKASGVGRRMTWFTDNYKKKKTKAAVSRKAIGDTQKHKNV